MDESSSEGVKPPTTDKKIPVVPKPNEEEHKKLIQAETVAIEELRVQLNALKAQRSAHTGGKETYLRTKDELRQRMGDYSRLVDQLERERDTLMTEIDERLKEGRDIKTKVTSMKKSIKYKSEEEIDAKIREIEAGMMQSTLSIKAEKQLMAQISQLKKDKPLVGKCATMEVEANTFDDSSVGPTKVRLDLVRTDLKAAREAKKVAGQQLAKLLDDRSKAMEPVRECIDEIERLNQLLTVRMKTKRDLQYTFNDEMRKYETFQRLQQKKNADKIREEREKRQVVNDMYEVERKIEQAESELPLVFEIILANNTLAHVNRLKANSETGPAVVEEKAVDTRPTELRDQGVLLVPKSQREEEYLIQPKGKKNRKQNKKAYDTVAPKLKTLTHSFNTLTDFGTLGVDPPLSVDDLGACQEALEAKVAEYKQLQVDLTKDSSRNLTELREKMAALEIRQKELGIAPPVPLVK